MKNMQSLRSAAARRHAGAWWALGLMAALALSACGRGGAPEGGAASAASQAAPAASGAARPLLTVETVTAQAARWAVTVSAHGAVAPWQEAVIGAEVGGLRLDTVAVNVGDSVRRGQVLATLRQDTLGADVAATRASLLEAEALLGEARANAERARTLIKADAMSSQEAQRAFTAELTARARVDVLKAQLASTELRLAQSRVLAPDDGVISGRQATAGAVVQAGQELFRLIRQHRLEWRAEVAATDLHRVRPGQVAEVTGPSGQKVEARVRMVAPTVDAATRNGLVYVDLPVSAAQAAALKAGMFVPGRIDLGASQGLTLPQSAVLLRDGFSYVFTVGGDGKVQQRKVRTGRRSGERVEVIEGLPAGVAVVATGAGFLSDGDTVRVRAPAAGARP